ncbi:helix-turn-helix transcriptional regulator [Desulfotruncus alcoholivorax]|uniref:helix-turn-helix transcriptional regulator n=1 Tax=Desulfotruncus alcoholivorax TaxID=265477 RepID=UPI0003F7FC46|nr:helix-turn-helix transcriptional regulator [Desulfotruncus alcoholivorax]
MKEVNALTPAEVAGILRITKNTVYELIKRGELPAYRVGRKIRVDINDVEKYKKRGRKLDVVNDVNILLPDDKNQVVSIQQEDLLNLREAQSPAQGLVICGQDVLLDILTRRFEQLSGGIRAFRHYVGSFAGLLNLYQGKAQMAAIHLWDGDQDIYNIPYVRRLLPGMQAIVVHLACRMQGFYVAGGNPKGINDWRDLTGPGVVFVNREKGCGTRVLLDETLRLLKIDRRHITGYDTEENSHLAVASAVSRGEADVGLGCEKASLQVKGIDFIPLKKERYDLVIKKEDLEKPMFSLVVKIIQSAEFKLELQGLGDYDIEETGAVTEV